MTGTSAHDSGTLARVGALPPESPLGLAVAAGGLGLDAADVIHSGLGESAPDDAVLALIASASELSVEKLAARAREVRPNLTKTAPTTASATCESDAFCDSRPSAMG